MEGEGGATQPGSKFSTDVLQFSIQSYAKGLLIPGTLSGTAGSHDDKILCGKVERPLSTCAGVEAGGGGGTESQNLAQALLHLQQVPPPARAPSLSHTHTYTLSVFLLSHTHAHIHMHFCIRMHMCIHTQIRTCKNHADIKRIHACMSIPTNIDLVVHSFFRYVCVRIHVHGI